MGKLILLLLALPPLDLFLLVRLGHAVGGQLALLSVLVSGLIGVLVARMVGLRQLREWRRALAEGRAPSGGVVDGLLLLLGCLWLLVPGPLSDVLGLALFIAPVRRFIAELVNQRVRRAIEQGMLQVAVQDPRAARTQHWQPPASGKVIDVEGEVVPPPTAADAEPRKRLPS